MPVGYSSEDIKLSIRYTSLKLSGEVLAGKINLGIFGL